MNVNGNLMGFEQHVVSENLRDCLLALRQDNGWTQSDLAEKTGVSVMTIRRYEALKGGKSLDIGFLNRLAALMAVNPWELLGTIMGESEGSGESFSDSAEPFLRLLRTGDPEVLEDLGKIKVTRMSLIATELLHIAEVFLKAPRLEQLELLLDIYRRALSSPNLTRSELALMREYTAEKMQEYRKELLR